MPRDNFKIFFFKNVVLYEIYSKKSRVANTYVHVLYVGLLLIVYFCLTSSDLFTKRG